MEKAGLLHSSEITVSLDTVNPPTYSFVKGY